MSREEENKQFESESSRFGLPEGYFQQSARSVLNRVEWLEEHKVYARLGSLERKPPFGVPAGYFAGAEQRMELLDFPNLAALKKHYPFAVPADYFEELEVMSLSKAMDGEEPDLSALPKPSPFRVQDTYFIENSARLEQMLGKQPEKSRVIRLFGARTVRFAAAALLLLALGTWLYTTYRPARAVLPDEDCATIACLDRQELLKSKTLENLETDELYDLVNSKELEKKLENKNAAPGQKAADSLDDAAMDDLMDEI